ncbi:MAG: hypothetical protein JOZ83_00560 [Silvibacterium sp.]|nr:hypothetical protein [Silvibacterium sp.]
MRKALLFLTACFCGAASAQSSVDNSKCPVGFERVDVRYDHAGGESVPQMRLAFANQTRKTVTGFVFSLAVFDSGGNPTPYPYPFEYRRGIPPGEPARARLWKLDPASVDIHRSGERVTLLEATFADGSIWKDNGSRACSVAFDYRSR